MLWPAKLRQEKGAQTQTFCSGYLLVWGLPREGVGVTKFGMSFETQENLDDRQITHLICPPKTFAI